jgi:hypothetical protein
MENKLKCPNCNIALPNSPVLEAAVNNSGYGIDIVMCECGEKLTYWDITDQLKKQKKRSWKIKNWMQKTFNAEGNLPPQT